MGLLWKVILFQISPHNYGIPQQRERIYFVCIRNDIFKKEIELIEKPYKKVIDMSNFLQKKEEIDEKYFRAAENRLKII